jgi:CMP-N,N'-diacetyllegionaminic acid synthase
MPKTRPLTLGLIPARSGSKGIPGKNLSNLGGRPLIEWTIRKAQLSELITRIVVSTDDPKIASVANSLGCDVPFLRPEEISGDETPMIDVACHALNSLKEPYQYLVLLQPTSPFRSANDIDNCIRRCNDDGAPSCVSISETEKSPYWTYKLDRSRYLSPIMGNSNQFSRRQDVPKSYAINGAVYVSAVKQLKKIRQFISPETLGYIMPPERAIDIDTPFQLKIAQLLAENG